MKTNRQIRFGMAAVLLAWAVLAVSPAVGQPSRGDAARELRQPKSEQSPPLDPVEGRKQARDLVNRLLSLKPTENMRETLTLKIINADDKETELPVSFEIICTPTNFLNVYQTTGAANPAQDMKLTIAHNDAEPNMYLLSQPVEAPSKQLSASELMRPFAGSDFWIADLGLEFLHWPEQRIVRKQMRRYVFCDELESINPHPTPGGYSKVLSWIGANRPEELVLVHAEAFDAKGKLLKQFDPKKLEKINGSYQLDEMEIRNRQADTRSRIEFNVRSRSEGS